MRRRRFVNNSDFFTKNFDLTGFHVLVNGALRTTTNQTSNAHNVLRAYAVCRVKCFYCIWVKYHLHETFTVTHIKKYDTTVIAATRSEEHTSELQSRPHLVCRLLLEKKNNII